MGKLFQLALEEAIETQPEVVEEIPVEELVNNAEELAKTDSEIAQDVQAVEDLMEEKAKLEEQVSINDELLSNPDAVVTAADVEVSEECRNEVYYHLGYTSGVGKLRLSTESVYTDVKANPRKYLAISNEDIKETIKKIWEKIKAFFKKIIDKVGLKKKLQIIKSKTNDAYMSTVGKVFKNMSREEKDKPIFNNDGNLNVSTEDYMGVGDYYRVMSSIPCVMLSLSNGKLNNARILIDEKSMLKDVKEIEKIANICGEILNRRNDIDGINKLVDTLYIQADNIDILKTATSFWYSFYKYCKIKTITNEKRVPNEVIKSLSNGELHPRIKDILVIPSTVGAGTTALKTFIFAKNENTGMYTNSGEFEAEVDINKIGFDKSIIDTITYGKLEELVSLYNETSTKTGLIQEYTNSMIRIQKIYENIDNTFNKSIDDDVLKLYPDFMGVINAIGCFVIPGLSNSVLKNRASIKKLIESLKLVK